MSDPFEVWRLACSTAFIRSLELLGDVFAPYAALSPPQNSYAIDLSSFPTFQRVRLDLNTMFLLETRRSAASARPVMIVGPYAVHDAAIADFAEGHSLAGALTEEGAGPLALTFWKSATAQMRDYGIDAYLSDLNVAVDDLGGRVSPIGICQGGWLAAAYAARFPRKVEKLVAANPTSRELSLRRRLRRSRGRLRSPADWCPERCHPPFLATIGRPNSTPRPPCRALTSSPCKSSKCGTRAPSICPGSISPRPPNGSFVRTVWRTAPSLRSAGRSGWPRSWRRSSLSLPRLMQSSRRRR